jgi:hypothetical protein
MSSFQLDYSQISIKTFLCNWANALRKPQFIIQLLIALGGLTGLWLFTPGFLDFIQQRPGIYIHDWLLDAFPAHDISWFTFTFIMGGAFIAFAYLLFFPEYLVLAIQTYVLVTWMRMLAIYFTPWQEPPGTIPLKDPFMAFFVYDHRAITRDLFFSGHVSFISSLALSMPNKLMKYIFWFFGIVIAVCILIQHVHYTVDVLFAPPFALLSFAIVRFNLKKSSFFR